MNIKECKNKLQALIDGTRVGISEKDKEVFSFALRIVSRAIAEQDYTQL
jgi:hypothetical protein